MTVKYDYDGCPLWKWYFLFHYAPFASDLRNIALRRTSRRSS
jgi:5'-3' exoribonuclease 2